MKPRTPRVNRFLFFVIAFTSITSWCAHASQLDMWTLRNPLPLGNPVYQLIYGDGLFVAGCGDLIGTSPDGLFWTNQSYGSGHSLGCIAYGGGTYFAIEAAAFGGSTQTFSSKDGANWSTHATTNPNNNATYWDACTYGNNLFIAVGQYSVGGGYSNLVMKSPDGVSWTNSFLTNSSSLRNLTFGDGLFIAVGDGGQIATSQNGGSWTNQNSGTTQTLYGVTYGKGIFVAVGTNPSEILTSSNGIAWSSHDSGTTNSLYSVYYAANSFVAAGQRGALLTSPDGINWTVRNSGTSRTLQAIAYGSGKFIVATGSVILTSSNAVDWVQTNSGSEDSFQGSAAGSNVIVATGISSILSSPDGANWSVTRTFSTNVYYNDVTFGNGTFVAVGGNGSANIITTSQDGSNWVDQISNVSGSLERICYGGGRFIASGIYPAPPPGARILMSLDGAAWTNTLIYWPGIDCFVYGSNKFVAIGGNTLYSSSHQILTSFDGIIWTNYDSGMPLNGQFGSLAYGNGVFVAVGQRFVGSDYIITSPDSIHWTDRSTSKYGALHRVIFANGLFVASGSSGVILSSLDGSTWIQRKCSAAVSLNGLSYLNSSFVAVGSSGAIWQTADMSKALLNLQKPVNANAILEISGEIGRSYRLQASTDFSNWADIGTLTDITAPTIFVSDTGATNFSQRFYRALSQ